jgi:hypothetical protein
MKNKQNTLYTLTAALPLGFLLVACGDPSDPKKFMPCTELWEHRGNSVCLPSSGNDQLAFTPAGGMATASDGTGAWLDENSISYAVAITTGPGRIVMQLDYELNGETHSGVGETYRNHWSGISSGDSITKIAVAPGQLDPYNIYVGGYYRGRELRGIECKLDSSGACNLLLQ